MTDNQLTVKMPINLVIDYASITKDDAQYLIDGYLDYVKSKINDILYDEDITVEDVSVEDNKWLVFVLNLPQPYDYESEIAPALVGELDYDSYIIVDGGIRATISVLAEYNKATYDILDDSLELITEATQSSNIGQHKVSPLLSIDDEDDESDTLFEDYTVVDDTQKSSILNESLLNKTTRPYLVMVELVKLFIKDYTLTSIKEDEFDYTESDVSFRGYPSAKIKLTDSELDTIEDLLKSKKLIKGKPIKDNKGLVVIPAKPSKRNSATQYEVYIQPANKLLKIVSKVDPDEYDLESVNDFTKFGDPDED